MKVRIAKLLSAFALMLASSASLGCVWVWADEPKALKSMND